MHTAIGTFKIIGDYVPEHEFTPCLTSILNDTYQLLFMTRVYCWNVRHPYFGPLQQLLCEQYEELAEASATLAERIVQLDDRSVLACPNFALDLPAPGKRATEKAMVADLIARHENLGRKNRRAAQKAAEEQDHVSLETCKELLAFHASAVLSLRTMDMPQIPSSIALMSQRPL